MKSITFFIKNNSKRNRKPAFDRTLFITATALAVMGSIAVFSAGGPYAEFRYGDSNFFIKRQILWLTIGIITMLAASRLSIETYRKITPYLFFATIVLLVLTLLIGLVGNGAQRWLKIGPITIQPSEIAKMTVVMMLAMYFAKKEKTALPKTRRRILLNDTLYPIAIMLAPIILVMLQKHLSCIIILGVIGLLVIVASGNDARYIRLFTLIGIAAVVALALFTDYTKDRITVWLNPESYKLTGGWQTLQGLMAIGSGGIFGVGFGKSLLKYCYVSEPANDMIFAIVCEEMGFIGAVLTLSVFAFLIYRGYSLSMKQKDTFARLLIFGITTKIALQTLLNVGVVTNTIPNTGISLPFFSYGGSSLIMICFEIGMILAFSRYSKIEK